MFPELFRGEQVRGLGKPPFISTEVAPTLLQMPQVN